MLPLCRLLLTNILNCCSSLFSEHTNVCKMFDHVCVRVCACMRVRVSDRVCMCESVSLHFSRFHFFPSPILLVYQFVQFVYISISFAWIMNKKWRRTSHRLPCQLTLSVIEHQHQIVQMLLAQKSINFFRPFEFDLFLFLYQIQDERFQVTCLLVRFEFTRQRFLFRDEFPKQFTDLD